MFIYINAEYELFYKLERGETHPDEGKPFSVGCVDWTCDNDLFCKSEILFTNPNGAPEDEVALVCNPDGAGIMMEWERPISMSTPLVLANTLCDRVVLLLTVIISYIVRESARLLLEGMPKSGLRILNIGFGIGMVRNRLLAFLPPSMLLYPSIVFCADRPIFPRCTTRRACYHRGPPNLPRLDAAYRLVRSPRGTHPRRAMARLLPLDDLRHQY